MKRSLLLGCGSNRERKIYPNGTEHEGFGELTTLDFNSDHQPDILFDLMWAEDHPLPFTDNYFDELHAYEVLEHIGIQGDFRTFFAQFSDYWRVLKPGGYFIGTCPKHDSPWAWGDPSHHRVITPGTLLFLVQTEYEQVGKTAMSDFRFVYRADFDVVGIGDINKDSWAFILTAIKPSRAKG